MQSDIRQDIKILINDLRRAQEYRAYLDARRRVKENKELFRKAEEARSRLVEAMRLSDPEAAYEAQQELVKEIPEAAVFGPVRDYLDADAGLCALLREIVDCVFGGLDFEPPGSDCEPVGNGCEPSGSDCEPVGNGCEPSGKDCESPGGGCARQRE